MDFVALLRNGEVIGFPTDTVYGIGAAFSQLCGVRKIFTLKGRSNQKPLIAHVSSIEMALTLMEQPCEEFMQLARDFWPGPLTLIVKKSMHVSDVITGGFPTIGIRIPNCRQTIELIKDLGEPIVGTSANLSGLPCTFSSKQAHAALGDQVAGYVEGEVKYRIASTVYSLVDKKVLRKGPSHIL